MNINNTYAAYILIEILYDKGLINEATYKNIKKQKSQVCEPEASHI